MSNEIVVAIIALFGTILGSGAGVIVSNRLTTYRIVQLEKKINKHNVTLERMISMQGDVVSNTKDIEEIKDNCKEYRNGWFTIYILLEEE